MNELIQNSFNALTMSSREIATLCDKEHRHVLRDIDNLNETYGQMGMPKVGQTPYTHEQNGQTYHVRTAKFRCANFSAHLFGQHEPTMI